MKSRPLTDTEIAILTDNLTSIQHKCLFILGVKTGFRISELLSITVADVAGKDQVSVQRKNMKGKQSSRTVVLHQAAKDIVAMYLKEYQLTGDSKLFDFSRQWAYQIMRDAASLSGINGVVSTHSMRKTFGMNVYNKTNKDIVAAQMALGHKSLASTSHYLSVGQDTVDAAILA
jgi:integrase